MGAKCILETSGAPTSTTAGTTQYWFLANAAITVPQTAEINRQLPYRTPGTFSKLYVRIPTNTTTADSILVVRKNGADTALTITIPAGTATVVEDIIHDVTIAAGDKLCFKSVSGGTGTLSFSIMSVIFQPTATGNDAMSKMVTGPATAGYNFDNLTRFAPLVGTLTPNTATESICRTKIVKPTVKKFLAVFVSANARTTDTIIKSRKNGADGNITLTITAGFVGWVEDMIHEDSLNTDDEFNWSVAMGVGTQTLTIQSISHESLSIDGIGMLQTGASAGLLQNAGVTNYLPIAGNIVGASTIENNAKTKAREAFTFSGIGISVSGSTVSAPSTLRTRINGANGNQVISIPASTAGFFADTNPTHIDLVAAGDDVNYELTTGATGTNMTIRNTTMSHQIIVPAVSELTPIVEFGAGKTRKVRIRPELTRTKLAEPPTPKKFKITKESVGLVTIQFQISRLLLDQIPSIIFNPKIGKIPKPPKKIVIIRETFATPKKLSIVFERLLLSQENSIGFEFEAALLANASPAQLKRVHDKMLGDFTVNEQDRRRKQRLRRFRKLLRLLPF